MSLRVSNPAQPNPAKRALQKLRRAATATVHDRLNDIDLHVRQLADRLTEIDRIIGEVVGSQLEMAENQTALLQSNIHLVEASAQTRNAQDAGFSLVRSSLAESYAQNQRALDAQFAAIDSSFERVFALHEEFRRGTAALASSSFEEVSEEVRRGRAAFAAVEALLSEVRDYLATQSDRSTSIETSDYAAANPELGLMSFLYSYLPTHSAIDIGAHVGEVSQYLLDVGYDVYAFEPYLPSYSRLTQRLHDQARFTAFPLALGSDNGEALLHLVADATDGRGFDDPTVFHSLAPHGMPEGLTFTSTVPVPVRRLADLHHDGAVPQDISLVKIDTEGYDLDVVRGMGEVRYPVVVVEFWAEQIPFAGKGLRYTAQQMVAEMRQRGYSWYIVVYHVWGKDTIAFFSNHDQPVPHSWGNIFFFADRATFMQAQEWCSAVLARTFFKPVAPRGSAEALGNGTVG